MPQGLKPYNEVSYNRDKYIELHYFNIFMNLAKASCFMMKFLFDNVHTKVSNMRFQLSYLIIKLIFYNKEIRNKEVFNKFMISFVLLFLYNLFNFMSMQYNKPLILFP